MRARRLEGATEIPDGARTGMAIKAGPVAWLGIIKSKFEFSRCVLLSDMLLSDMLLSDMLLSDMPLADTATEVTYTLCPAETTMTSLVFRFAKAQTSTKFETIYDFMSLLDHKESPKKRIAFTGLDSDTIESFLRTARSIGGIKMGKRISCPVICMHESDEFTYSTGTVEVTMGTDLQRPKFLPTKSQKMDILSKLQIESDFFYDGEYPALVVGLREVECLVIIPMICSESMENDPDHSKRIGRRRAIRKLLAIRDHIHQFEEGVVYGFPVNLVNGNDGKITKSQSFVTKLLWRGLFDGYPKLNTEEIYRIVFKNRGSSKRKRDSDQPQTPPPHHPTTGGKQLLYEDLRAPFAGKGKGLFSTIRGKTLMDDGSMEECLEEPTEIATYLTARFTEIAPTIGVPIAQLLISFLNKARDYLSDEEYCFEFHQFTVMDAEQAAQELDQRIDEIIEEYRLGELDEELETLQRIILP